MRERAREMARRNRALLPVNPQGKTATHASQVDPLAKSSTRRPDAVAQARSLNRVTGGQTRHAENSLLPLQRSHGNRYVQRLLALVRQVDNQKEEESQKIGSQPITYKGKTSHFSFKGGCDHLNLHGTTDAQFDSRGEVKNQVERPGRDCACPEGVPCTHVTGTLVTDYTATVSITMPSMPDGLTPCEQSKVGAFLQNVLRPHEEAHRAALKTFEGRTRNPVDVTGCGHDDIEAKVQAIGDAEKASREAAANAKSGALDPFSRIIDCSGCDKRTP
jgi:hypothetical protein